MRTSYFIATAIIIVLAGLAVAGYFLFLAKETSVVVVPPTASSTSQGLPVLGSDTGSSGATSIQEQALPITTSSTTPTPSQIAPRLVEIDPGPVVAGLVAFDTIATSTTASATPDVQINYLERESGNVFSYLFHAATLTRISNRTIPGIEEADWTPDGKTAFIRYLSGSNNLTINTYALPSMGEGGFFLSQDIDELSVSSAGVLAVASGVNGSIATTEHPDGTGAVQAFTTPLSSIRAQSLGGGRYLAFTKPSASIPGYAFIVTSAGNFTRVAGPLNGLVALASPAGDYALISYSDAGAMGMEIVNLKTFAVTPLPVATIADKCVWASNDTDIYCGVPIDPSTSYSYPDDWYQGAASFSDRIWEINVSGDYAQLVLDFTSQTGQALDATDLSIDPKGLVLAFRNKVDGSLWAYQL